MLTKLYDFKVSGRTAASTDGTATGIIATKAVEFYSDGSLKFTNSAGQPVTLNPSPQLNELLKIIFTGTGGVAAGKKFHGVS